MADETHVHDVRRGAALAAPTAPHATAPSDPPGPPRKRTGPERFWERRRVRIAGVVCVAASLVIHFTVSPWALLPAESIEVKDQAGDLEIPIDLFQEAPPEPAAPPPPAPPPPPPPASPKSTDTASAGGLDASARDRHDAGERARDAAAHDAALGADAIEAPGADAAPSDAELGDAGAEDAAPDAPEVPDVPDARDQTGFVAALGDGGLASLGDARVAANGDAGSAGARDQTALLGGAAAGVNTGPQNIEVILNMEIIKTNAVGARLGPLLAALPQWRDFFASTGVDPVRDGDWFMLFGPSLANTERDAALVHFNMTDARAAKALDTLSKHDIGGGPFDAGVPGVKAWRGRADRAARVFLLPRPHLAVVVPPDFAHKAALAFARGASFTPTMTPGEAVRGRFKNPHGSVAVVPETISQLRIWAVPRPEGGADVLAEGDCADAASASAAAASLTRFVRGQNALPVQIMTRGVLNNVELHGDGALLRGHLVVSQEQLEALVGLAAAILGVSIDPVDPVAPAPKAAPHR